MWVDYRGSLSKSAMMWRCLHINIAFSFKAISLLKRAAWQFWHTFSSSWETAVLLQNENQKPSNNV